VDVPPSPKFHNLETILPVLLSLNVTLLGVVPVRELPLNSACRGGVALPTVI
jgi:hypothetical protein